MKARLVICLGVIGLLLAAAPGFAPGLVPGAAYAQERSHQNWGKGRPNYQRQAPQQPNHQSPGYQQRAQQPQPRNDNSRTYRRDPASEQPQQRQQPQWQARPDDNSRGKGGWGNDNWGKNNWQKNNRGKDNQQWGTQKKQESSQDRRRAPSSLLPEDEKRRAVMQQFMPHDRARQAVESGQIRSYGDIRRTVKQQFNGRIVGMDLLENRGGGPSYVYDVRVLTQSGEVLSVDMDARTGQVLGVRRGR